MFNISQNEKKDIENKDPSLFYVFLLSFQIYLHVVLTHGWFNTISMFSFFIF